MLINHLASKIIQISDKNVTIKAKISKDTRGYYSHAII